MAELLSQGQMTGLCAETYSPFLSTVYFLGCKGMFFSLKWQYLLFMKIDNILLDKLASQAEDVMERPVSV